MMKRFLMSAAFLLLMLTSAVSAEDSVLVFDKEAFMCGDAFEIIFPDIPSSSGMVSNAGQVHAIAGPDERLLQVRVQMRNMTPYYIQGLTKECFHLVGHIRDRFVTYTPEVITFTDYFGSGNHFNWDNLPPLRMADILLIFRVKPVLVDWDLIIDTRMGTFAEASSNVVRYPSGSEEQLCYGTFRFNAVRTLETGITTKFYRELRENSVSVNNE